MFKLLLVIFEVILFVAMSIFMSSIVYFQRVRFELSRDSGLLGLHFSLKKLQLLITPGKIPVNIFLQLGYDS